MGVSIYLVSGFGLCDSFAVYIYKRIILDDRVYKVKSYTIQC